MTRRVFRDRKRVLRDRKRRRVFPTFLVYIAVHQARFHMHLEHMQLTFENAPAGKMNSHAVKTHVSQKICEQNYRIDATSTLESREKLVTFRFRELAATIANTYQTISKLYVMIC